MIKDLVESLTSNIKERASSPLLGSFTVFFVALNWKGLVVLCTSDAKSFNLISEVLTVIPNHYSSIGLSLLFAVIFSMAYPYAKAFVFNINSRSREWEISVESRLEEKKEQLANQRARRNAKGVADALELIETLLSSGELTDDNRYKLSKGFRSLATRYSLPLEWNNQT